MKYTTLRNQVKKFRDARELRKQMEIEEKTQQSDIIPGLIAAGVDNKVGLIIDPHDEKHGVAYVQQNSPSDYWATEEIIEYLHKKPSLWRDCSSRVFDVQKWEVAISHGTIRPSTAQKFRRKGDAPAPFIRFGKKNEGSL